ncbi:hypothetical protein TNCT_343731 [Trichonephila clavata]|uniref:Uncharacterized protein n=1 Tax=Trichonephila clavata TaxID=2740835 RepID=A0A8X6IIB4_TRICU|nr:hypothetical protein TNCT_343731 [Trichonephila clavata]
MNFLYVVILMSVFVATQILAQGICPQNERFVLSRNQCNRCNPPLLCLPFWLAGCDCIRVTRETIMGPAFHDPSAQGQQLRHRQHYNTNSKYNNKYNCKPHEYIRRNHGYNRGTASTTTGTTSTTEGTTSTTREPRLQLRET